MLPMPMMPSLLVRCAVVPFVLLGFELAAQANDAGRCASRRLRKMFGPCFCFCRRHFAASQATTKENA